MKFVFFIASTMLIVLINQHSTMGLPVIDDRQPMTMTITEQMPVLKQDPERRDGDCPVGWVHGEHGICQEVKLIKPMRVLNKEPERRFGACPKGMVRGAHSSCQIKKHTEREITPTDMEVTETATTAPKESELTETTTVPKESELTETTTVPKESELTETTTVPKESELTETTTVRKESELTETTAVPKESELPETTTVGKINLNDCPKGTKKDEQGSCQEIEPTNTRNVPVDPKVFLLNGGFCPQSFKMVNGTCLYIKPKSTTPFYPVLSNGIKPKDRKEESIEYEKVRINADGTCPEGTEYSEYGFCQKRISPSKSKFDIKPDEKCPADFESINGKCSPKNSKVQDQSSEASTTSASPLPSESTTIAAEPKVDPKSEIETATVNESSQASTTSASPLPSESTTIAAEPKVDPKSEIETATVKDSSAESVSPTTSQPL